MGSERGARKGRSNGRQLGIADKIRTERAALEPSFSGYKAEGERVLVLDRFTGIMLWSSVDPRFKK